MARRRNKKQQEETLVDLVEAKEQASDYVNQNSNLIIGGLVALFVIFGGYFAYQQFVSKPNEMAAQEAMRFAQDQFARDSFALALDNPGGGNPGFLDIIDEYSGTAAGNTALYYAGISYLNLGNYQAAIDYLNDFDAEGDLTPITKFGAMADAYGELNQFDEAISNYKKAISNGENEALVTYYMKKLGLLYEKQGDATAAKELFEKIKTDYPDSAIARDIDKFIARVAAKQ
jgi:tetratricopeptide (TPR) repeat protein